MWACQLVLGGQHQRIGIGSLGEKPLHAIIKNYLEPNPQNQEVAVQSHIADIFNRYGIIEIQTGSFGKINKKLQLLLPDYPITLVYPAAVKKTITWIDPATGEAVQTRQSPKHDNGLSVFYQLPYIKPENRCHNNLHLCILQLAVHETKLKNGYGKNQKKRAQRTGYTPVGLHGQVYFKQIKQLSRLLPFAPQEEFDVAMLQHRANISRVLAQRVCKVLTDCGALMRDKQGRKYLYKIL